MQLNFIKTAKNAKLKLQKKLYNLSFKLLHSLNLKKKNIDKIENKTAGKSFPNSEILVNFKIK